MRRGTIWLYWPKNGSGKRSPYARCGFTLGGKEYRLPTGHRERGAALERAAALLAEECRHRRLPVPEGAFQDLGDRELAMVAQSFLADVQARLAARTLVRNPRYHENLEQDLRCHVLSAFKRLEEIDRDSWERVLQTMRAQTGKRVTVTLRQMLKWAWGAGLISAVPQLAAPSGEEVQRQQAERVHMNEAQRDRFLRQAKKLGRPAWRRFRALLWGAHRKSTIEKMTLRQVDFQAHYFRPPPRMIKSRKIDQSFWMDPEFEKVVKEEIAARRSIAPDQPIFGRFDLREEFWAAVDVAKIPREGLVPHHFARRTAATLAGERGASLAQLMAMGGWETPTMARKYMHVGAELSKGAWDLLHGKPRRRVRAV